MHVRTIELIPKRINKKFHLKVSKDRSLAAIETRKVHVLANWHEKI